MRNATRIVSTTLLATMFGCMGHRAMYVSAPSPSVYAMPRPDSMTAEEYKDWGKNPWVDATKDHLSTFAADVDTASYTVMRKKLHDGQLPPEASVRVEEYVNYFRYAMPAPAAGSQFGVVMDAAPSPLAANHYMLRVGVGTKTKTAEERKPAHLVFLVDVSGSMSEADKLPLAQQSLRILVNNLADKDTVSLVTYAGGVRLVLPPTGVDQKAKILGAIEELAAGGSTAMASGIDLAYAQAEAGLSPNAISRVIVLTDGDANVGPVGHKAILDIIAKRAKAGVTLTTVGFGMGNYKDGELEQLADKGNGNALYIDSLPAAKKAFAEQLGSNLEVVAKDVKLQVDFDPSVVSKYRLVGYENRDLDDRDFRNDKVDAGQVGAGHQVTAMYEIETADGGGGKPMGSVHVRSKAPDGAEATPAKEEVFAMGAAPSATFEGATDDFRFALAVAAFADVMRGAPDAKAWSLEQIAQLARDAAGADPDRKEFVDLVETARKLRGGGATVNKVAS